MVERCEGVPYKRGGAMTNQGRACMFLALFGGLPQVCSSLPVQAIDQQNGFTGRIIRIEPGEPKGRLRIKQGAGARFIEAAESMLVRRGHLLLVEGKVRVTIRCGDGSDHDLVPGPQGCPCISQCIPEICGISHDGSTIRSTRHDSPDGVYPTIISPRPGLLLDRRPAIRWIPPSEAKGYLTYTVSLRAENNNVLWCRTVVSKTELAYPNDAPPLTPGRPYSAVVSTYPAAVDAEDAPELTFTAMPWRDVDALRKKVRRLSRSRLPKTERRFLIANLYAAKGLYTEAISQLENRRLERSLSKLRMLGDLYLAVGLNREAEKRYLDALSLEPEDELEERALIQSGLGWVYEGLGLCEQAVERFGQARNAYEQLGDATLVQQLTRQIRLLTK